jgi:uncharacterized membrane protein
MLSPFLILAIVVAILTVISMRSYNLTPADKTTKASPVPLTSASIILGIGLGGFADGIVFHQLLQWHEMISNKLPPITLIAKSVNMFWDGVFHAFCLIVVIVGIVMLWRLLFRKDIERSGKLLGGGLLLGWGLFNLLEGIADHQVLKLHNVREVTADVNTWNIAFLAVSVVLIIVGFMLTRAHKVHA